MMLSRSNSYLKAVVSLLCIIFVSVMLYGLLKQDTVLKDTNTALGNNISIQDAKCPISTKRWRYSQVHIDTALFEKFWSNPLKCYGTFVELGAADGQQLSNTKFFEDYLGWSGVLIEAYTSNFNKIKLHRKNTVNHNVAICPEGQGYVEFLGKGLVGGVVDELVPSKIKMFKLDHGGEKLKVPCEPIGPLLRRSNITRIDLFSLDVEGGELTVLKTMDWSIPVHVFVIEMEGGEPLMENIRTLMKNKGYIAMKNEWDINTYDPKGVRNEVFVNPRYIE